MIMLAIGDEEVEEEKEEEQQLEPSTSRARIRTRASTRSRPRARGGRGGGGGTRAEAIASHAGPIFSQIAAQIVLHVQQVKRQWVSLMTMRINARHAQQIRFLRLASRASFAPQARKRKKAA